MSDDFRPVVNVQAIAQALAFHLPDWRFTAVGETPKPGDPDYEEWSIGNDYMKVRVRENRLTRATLVKGNLELVLTYSGYEKKVHIFGTFPTGYEPRNLYPTDSVPVTSINVNPAKDPKRIAGDIRRIGAAYEEAYAKATTLKAKHDHQKQATRALVARIAKALGVPDPATTERHGAGQHLHIHAVEAARDHLRAQLEELVETWEEEAEHARKLSELNQAMKVPGAVLVCQSRQHRLQDCVADLLAILRERPQEEKGNAEKDLARGDTMGEGDTSRTASSASAGSVEPMTPDQPRHEPEFELVQLHTRRDESVAEVIVRHRRKRLVFAGNIAAVVNPGDYAPPGYWEP